MFRLTSLLLTALLTLTVVAATVHATSVYADSATASQHIAVPAYFYPDSTPTMSSDSNWDRTDRGAPTVSIVIINPASGPGSTTTANSDYVTQVQRSHDAGLIVLGYVPTDYANRGDPGHPSRTFADVTADIDAYYKLYDVDGIFFDEVTTDCTAADDPAYANSHTAYYQNLYTYVKGKDNVRDTMVVLNPGTQTEECYAAISDIIVNFEGTYATYRDSYTATDWVTTYPDPDHFWHIIHDTSATDLQNAVALSTARNAGYVYITPNGEPNPYGALPPTTYFDNEIQFVANATT